MHTAQRGLVSRADGFALGLIATGAISVAVAAVVGIVTGTIAILGPSPTVAMPVTGGDVSALDDVAAVVAATYTSADVTFATLPSGVAWLLVLEGALPSLATIGVCLVAWWLGVQLMRARPFRRTMPAAMGAAAILVVVGGILGQVLGAWARAALIDDLARTDPEVTDVFWTFLIQLDLAPVGWGAALGLVAGAFAIGARLQRDTEGLV